MSTWHESDLLANGIRLHYYRTTPDGAGMPPVVLCHGYSDNALCWTALARALTPAYDVIMADARCHGRSEAPVKGNGPAAMAADLKGLIEALGLTQPVAVGHSMGAMQVFLASSLYPDLLRAAILEDPVWRDAPPAAPPRRQAERERQQRMTHDELLAENRAQHPTWDEETLQLFATAKRQLDGRVHTADIVTPRPWREVLAGVRCPTLVLTGDPAPGAIVTEAVAQAALALFAGLERVHIPGVGHHVRYEAPAPYTRAVQNYLARIHGG
ncbi:MAG: alpha/beta hydrolase [Chloroflexota bacterium]